ncbi:MAG: hypothetical protein ACI9FU_001991, partial [Granulosicoccus sp.]
QQVEIPHTLFCIAVINGNKITVCLHLLIQLCDLNNSQISSFSINLAAL